MNHRTTILTVSVLAVIAIVGGVVYVGWPARPILQRKSPVGVSTVVLPPDPGEAGKATLEGIDSDGDGVRDDVQRYIALTYPESERTRAALTQQIIVDQNVLLNAKNNQELEVVAQSIADVQNCMAYIFGSVLEARKIRKQLEEEIFNTPERIEAWELANKHLIRQQVTSARTGNKKSRCSFNPDEMRN